MNAEALQPDPSATPVLRAVTIQVAGIECELNVDKRENEGTHYAAFLKTKKEVHGAIIEAGALGASARKASEIAQERLLEKVGERQRKGES